MTGTSCATPVRRFVYSHKTGTSNMVVQYIMHVLKAQFVDACVDMCCLDVRPFDTNKHWGQIQCRRRWCHHTPTDKLCVTGQSNRLLHIRRDYMRSSRRWWRMVELLLPQICGQTSSTCGHMHILTCHYRQSSQQHQLKHPWLDNQCVDELWDISRKNSFRRWPGPWYKGCTSDLQLGPVLRTHAEHGVKTHVQWGEWCTRRHQRCVGGVR